MIFTGNCLTGSEVPDRVQGMTTIDHILAAIGNERISSSSLAHRLKIKIVAARRHLSILHRLGLIETYERDRDGYQWQLTGAGLKRLKEAPGVPVPRRSFVHRGSGS